MNSRILKSLQPNLRLFWKHCRRGFESDSIYASTIKSPECEDYLKNIREKLTQYKTGQSNYDKGEDVSRWEGIVNAHDRLLNITDEIKQLTELVQDENDGSLKKMVEDDKRVLQEQLDEAIDELVVTIIPLQQTDVLGRCQMEFTSGAGGVESMYFADEVCDMYRKLAANKGWKWTEYQTEAGPQGGIRSAIVLLEGERVYPLLRFEAGVHRVQRIPKTDPTRMHTSTISIAVLPEPEQTQVDVLSTDCKLETMRASGPGGQNVNKRSSAVRITHIPSGFVVQCMEERFQHMNVALAYKRLGAMLLQQKVDEVYSKISSSRKLQVGSRARAEKVRTYNFPNDRITDHRLKLTLNHLDDFMGGGPKLEYMIDELQKLNSLERIQEEINASN